MNSKICNKCKETKLCDYFPKAKRLKDGYGNICKKCIVEYGKVDRFANPEKFKTKTASYYAKNKVYENTRTSKWYYENKDIILDKVKQNRLENPNKYIDYSKKTRCKNKEKIKEKANAKSINLTDAYVLNNLTRRNNLTYKDIPQELIELKRLELKINRKIKEMTK